MELLKNKKLCYLSSYDRGLEDLLKMWPKLIAVEPDLQLHIAYGWDIFDRAYNNNAERMAWKEKMDLLMMQKGITHYGRVSKDKLKEIRQNCGILAYPCNFFEINCITMLEAQRDGLVPVIIQNGNLAEVIKRGMMIANDDNKLSNYFEALKSLISSYDLWKKEADKKVDLSFCDIKNVAKEWDKAFIDFAYNKTYGITVYTPTIRTGWEKDMINVLNTQQNVAIDWVVIDGGNATIEKEWLLSHVKLNHIKSTDTNGRNFGLARANNLMLKHAKYEKIIFLQDWCVKLDHGLILRDMCRLSDQHKNALIAGVDIGKDKDGKIVYQNARINNAGLREATNAFDFEQNFCLVPKKIALDLNGWYEFFDHGLGYDNTEFALRALYAGYKILIDETSVASFYKHTDDQAVNSKRNMYPNNMHFKLLEKIIKDNSFAIRRNEALDEFIRFDFRVPTGIEKSEYIKQYGNKFIESNYNKVIQFLSTQK